MKQPPSIQPASGPGPNYDPIDRLVENLQNIETFLLKLEEDPKDLNYLNTHLSHILPLRRTIAHQLNLLQEDPYLYSQEALVFLHKENEKLFSYLEGVVGAIDPWEKEPFEKFIKAAFHSLESLDEKLYP